MRRCTKCGESKPLDQFYFRKSRPGPNPHCKVCLGAKNKAYREANRDALRAKDAERRADNREAKAEYDRAYRAANAEAKRAADRARYFANLEAERQKRKEYRTAHKAEIAARDADYYQVNRDKRMALSRAWREQNPDRYRELNTEAQRRRRARKIAAQVGPVDLEILWDGSCAICREALSRELRHPDPSSPSVDHIIPLSRGGAHAQDNLQWTHLVCNIRKGAKFGEESECA